MPNPLSVNDLQRAGGNDKQRIRDFYGVVLGWSLQEIHEGLDISSCSGEITVGVQDLPPDQVGLTDEQHRNATWTSLRADDREDLVAPIRAFGVAELPDQSDETSFFFQAPAGQVDVC